MADFLDEKLAELDRRLKELEPLHEEYLRLERARAALSSIDGGGSSPRARAPRSGNGRRSPGPVVRRRREGGTRAEQALAVVRQNPGITVSDLAAELKIEQANYMYRVMANLQADGAVRKQGRGYVAS